MTRTARIWGMVVAVGVGLFCGVHAASAATFYVGIEGAEDTLAHGQSPDSPFATLVYAEQQAADGDVIEIAPGEYEVEGFLHSRKAVTWSGAGIEDVYISFTDRGRGILLGATAGERRFQHLTLHQNDPNNGPAFLVDQRAEEANTTFESVRFQNGRKGAFKIPVGKDGIRIEHSEIIGDIESYWAALYLAGGIHIHDTDITMTERPHAPLGLIHQFAPGTGKFTIDNSRISVADNDYVFRLAHGGYTEPEITENSIRVPDDFSRTVIQMKGHVNEIITHNNISVPSTIQSAYGIVLQSRNGMPSVARVNNNVIRLHNPSGYGILIGDEGGNESVDGAYDGSFIQGNEIYGAAFFGHEIGVGHALMAGFNKDMQIQYNRVEGSGYCIVAKHFGESWEEGEISNNTCVNNRFGIRLKGVSRVVVQGNEMFSDNGANVTAFDISAHRPQDLANNARVVDNIISLDAGEVYNFRDASQDTFFSYHNAYDLFADATMGNLWREEQHAELASWQQATGFDAESYVWNRRQRPEVNFSLGEDVSSEGDGEMSIQMESSAFYPYPVFAHVQETNHREDQEVLFSPGTRSSSFTIDIPNDNIANSAFPLRFVIEDVVGGVIGGQAVHEHIIEDDDVASVHIVQQEALEVTEVGDDASYQIVLSSEPTHDVSIELQPESDQLVFQPLYFFTPENWNIPQEVQIFGVEDEEVEGEQRVRISHVSRSDDLSYDDIEIEGVVVTVIDDDEETAFSCNRCGQEPLVPPVPRIVDGDALGRPLVLINDGDAQTASRRVFLNFDVPQAKEMMVSRTDDFEGIEYAPYKKQTTWLLNPGRGQKSVFVRFKLNNGTIVQASDGIFYRSDLWINPKGKPLRSSKRYRWGRGNEK